MIFFEKKSNYSYFFNLRAFINKEIAYLNIKNVENIEMDTYSDSKNYEVKKDFFDKFISQNKNNEIFFKLSVDEKFLFDLRGFINKEILNLGIKNIENIEMDTFSNKEFFYSYRRSQLNKEKNYGRCISVILMT